LQAVLAFFLRKTYALNKRGRARYLMIVFRRKKREQIVINGNITVTVMHIRGTRVSLGIEAPEGVRILRTELSPHGPFSALALVEPLEAATSALPLGG
jgi:carbon storage regulator CsrA